MGKKRSSGSTRPDSSKKRKGSGASGVSNSFSHQTMNNVSGKQASGSVFRRLVGSTKGKSLKKRVALIEKNVMSDQEVKYLFNQHINIPIVTNCVPTVNLLNGIQRGVAVQQRIGDTTRALCVTMTGIAYVSDDAVYRIMIVADRESNGLGLPLSGTNSLFGQNPIPIYSMLELNSANTKRYNVIHDEIFRLGVAAGDYVRPFKIKKKLNFKVGYKLGNTGTYTDISSNAIWLLTICYIGNVEAQHFVEVDMLYEYLDS